jgi:single-strand DNA-binding protein
MSVNTTQITVVGKVVSDVDTRNTPSGVRVANFRLMCQERVFDKAQDAWVDGDRMYVRVTCWRKLAENVVESLRQGDQVVVIGRLKVREYEGTGGGRQKSIEVDARAVGPDLTLHTVMVNRPDWISPHQQRLVNPPPWRPAPDEPDEAPVKEDAVQAA